jgi:hypothetical protein
LPAILRFVIASPLEDTMTTTRQLLCALSVAAATLSFGSDAFSGSGSLVLDELFSSADRKLQYIQLKDVGPSQLAGMSLVASDFDGTRTTLIFPATSALGPPRGNYILIVSKSLSERSIFGPGGGVAEWDYLMPDGFLPSGGSISLGSMDSWDYERLPADSASALFRSGGIGIAMANSSQHGVVARFDIDDLRFVHEFVNPSSGRYFFTAFDGEVDALDSGRITGWHEIYDDSAGGTGFAGYGRRIEAMSYAVCRFYVPPPSDSHFFTASDQECVDVQARFPEFVLETRNALWVGLPDPATGACGPGLWPLYRLWKPGTNDHWYTADDQVRDQAQARGYVPEGYGPTGVGMCVIGTCYGNAC